MESQHNALKEKHTILTGRYKLLENANRSTSLDGKTKLGEQKFASEKELKKQDTTSQREKNTLTEEKEALELRVATLEETLAQIQAAGSQDQQYTDSTDLDAFGRLSVNDDDDAMVFAGEDSMEI